MSITNEVFDCYTYLLYIVVIIINHIFDTVKTMQQIGTAIIVVGENNAILLGERKSGFRSGNYGLPGGRVDPGEKLKTCAKRELAEETNLIAQQIDFLVTIKEWQPDRKEDFVHFIFVCKEWSGKVTLLEPNKCVAWKWIDSQNLLTNILPGHLAGIRYFQHTTSQTHSKQLIDM